MATTSNAAVRAEAKRDGIDLAVTGHYSVMSERVPVSAGIGLRSPHVAQVLAERPAVPWFEVHSENYFADGGPALRALERIRADYPSPCTESGCRWAPRTGSICGIWRAQVLVDRIDPMHVSEHLCWSGVGGRHYNDLLPLPTPRKRSSMCAHGSTQSSTTCRGRSWSRTCRRITFSLKRMRECDFVAAVATRTGCSILLDVNNIHVNAVNHGDDALAFLEAIVPGTVGEIHLAGFERNGERLIDTHGAPVAPEVWSLYEAALHRLGPVATLIEWDTIFLRSPCCRAKPHMPSACSRPKRRVAA